MMNYQTLVVEQKERALVVTINRPDKLNALNAQVRADMQNLFTRVRSDPNVDVVILTGAGEKAFVAGADIQEFNSLNADTGKDFAAQGQAVFDLVEQVGKPVIAAVNGYALGGGCELALACHIRIASENAKFGQPEVNLGIIPGYGGTQRLARLVGKGKAVELILTGNQIDAREAHRIGLVNSVVPASELLPAAMEIARQISSKAQVAVRLALQAIGMTDEVSLSVGQKSEAFLFGTCCGTEDFKEGTGAFLGKRKPAFKNK
jgi:enoyl-CoA hydratase